MPVPDFSPGEILTAAVMDSVGLWRVTGCTVTSVGGTAATASNGVITVGTGNTSVTVNNAFSSNFDNYRIIYTNGSASTTASLNVQLGSATTNYFNSTVYTIFASGVVGSTFNNGVTGAFVYAGACDATNGTHLTIDVFSPFLTKSTGYGGSFIVTDVSGHTGGLQKSNTSFTSFTITPGAGTLTGGQIRVYGYNK
jgi:hypothetical protein